MLACDLTI